MRSASLGHVLRHTAASPWLSHGLSLAKVAAYLGDMEEAVLATHAHFMLSDDDRAREAMGAFLPGHASEMSRGEKMPSHRTPEPWSVILRESHPPVHHPAAAA